ncbi:core-2/I-Branching enzyme [Rhodovulum imhoffii]|uniref:Peptide O-xylosyltransferase n=1 Tax=Rhodovulum imhoffii TaxID=365340 RepID=A0A2T5BPG2_9RHOB|nr:beta-1,6-N-acetylglucosaminyltransferase [Rhodovulum imhoffii]MBK5932918.1 glycosyl transferase [Rhodovulum imhoffii]PTN00854.1 core-2/I-Branching enzyme [Rhodovulum imhoffii]
MSVGFIILAHSALHRVGQVATHLARSQAPVVLHIDQNVPKTDYTALRSETGGHETIRFAPRHRCEWGMWSIIEATKDATGIMLEAFPDIQHVYLMSGSCIPLRPVADLRAYLDRYPETDFIESVTTLDVPWARGGLEEERFTLHFPFPWRRKRKLFDRYVALQRRLGLNRHIPEGLVPHLGSQWWCLSRKTLEAIFSDPDLPRYDRYFRRVWIPDESYFQTLVRCHGRSIESHSLTLSKFDHEGRPHIFYNDHTDLLRRSGCFFARKIWPEADTLYDTFLNAPPAAPQAEPETDAIDRLFSAALDKRLHGRAGLYMSGRWPTKERKDTTAASYSVFQGFNDLFPDFGTWLSRTIGGSVHGHIFAPDRAHFAGGVAVYKGGLPDSAALRDYNPEAFLCNLIWNNRGERQCFLFSPADRQQITRFLAADQNAQINVISGAWALPLFRSNRTLAEIRTEAVHLQKAEAAFLDQLHRRSSASRVHIWTLAEFLHNPLEALQTIIDDIAPHRPVQLASSPETVPMQGFARFLQMLKNDGMKPYLTGDFPVREHTTLPTRRKAKPTLVK